MNNQAPQQENILNTTSIHPTGHGVQVVLGAAEILLKKGSILAHFVRSVLLERVRRELSGLRLDRGIGEHRPG